VRAIQERVERAGRESMQLETMNENELWTNTQSPAGFRKELSFDASRMATRRVFL